MRVGSVFSGIAGFDLAFERAGARVAWQVEIDESCQRVLARHWPDVPRFRNVREVTGSVVGSVDAMVGGFPCQDLSVAGKRAGLAGERSGLFHEFARLIAQVRPRWLVLENVPGLLSSNGGRDMGTVLGTLGKLGYGWAYRCLDAQYFGLAQRRQRVFIVGCLGDSARAAQVLFEPESCSGNPPPSREAGQRVAASLTSGSHGAGVNEPGRHKEDDVNLVAACLTGGTSGTRSHGKPNGSDRRELVACNWQASSTANGVTRSGATAGSLGTSRVEGVAYVAPIAGTLPAMGLGCGQEDHAGHIVAYQCQGTNVGKMGTLRQGNGHVTGGVPFVAQSLTAHGSYRYEPTSDTMIAHTLRGEGADASEDGTGRGTPLVAVHPTLAASTGGPASPDWRAHAAIQNGMAVRRLTPTECERLQGFPDGWTDGQADSTRYRQLGNAVAIPVVSWIMRRLMEVADA